MTKDIPDPEIKINLSSPGSNAAGVQVLGTTEYPEISFASSPKGGPAALWFNLTVEMEHPEKLSGLRFRLRHLNSLLGGGSMNPLKPAYRIEQGSWERVDKTEIVSTADGRRELVWEMPVVGKQIQVAIAPSYGYEELNEGIKSLSGRFDSTEIGISHDGWPLLRLSNDFSKPGATLPGIYLTARQHAGETPGSWVMEGVLDTILESKEALLVWGVPMVDPDGVMEGMYGKDRFPWDFNRAWGSRKFGDLIPKYGSHPMRHEVAVIQQDIENWRERCTPVLILDLHSPGVGETDGIYCFHSEMEPDGSVPLTDRPWAEAIESALAEFASRNFLRNGSYHSRYGEARISRYGRKALGIRTFTLEIPYFQCGDRLMGIEDYREAGRRIGRGIAQQATKAT